MHLIAAVALKHTFWHLLKRLGGVGLILLGLLDNSLIPLPGSMDAFTIVLAAANKELWWYYAIMATIGSVIGGYLTYRLGVKGGKETMEKKFSKRRAEKIYHIFERYGFWSIVGGAMGPPPVPIVPFLLTAGAMKYPLRKFLTALTLGRAIRYTIIAYLGSIYGKRMFGWMLESYRPLLYVLIGLCLVGGAVSVYFWIRYKRGRQDKGKGAGRPTRRPAHKAA